MIARRGLLAVVVFVFSASGVWAAAPPARLTPDQKKQLAEAARWFRRANARFEVGEIAGAMVAIQTGLGKERAVFGSVRPAMINWLSILAGLQEQQDQFEEALHTRQEVLAVRQHW